MNERGDDPLALMQIRKAIMADMGEIFDVLAYNAYAARPKTRAERAMIGSEAIGRMHDEKLAAFLNYVLGHYVDTGIEKPRPG